uniref:Uncharacterized protein LOC108047998 n=1 Tax=Drosophila rhopaloa TaxID=1041015 RepID=A0A6P4FEH1_DRORH
MQGIIPILAIVLCGLGVVISLSCKECLTTDVYCINQTSYRNCINNVPIGNVINCRADTVCSNSNDVCVESSKINEDIQDVCGTSGGIGCGQCTSNKFTCVSQNQFVRCSGTTLIDSNIYNCDTDEVCISEAISKYENICVPSCARDFLNLKATCSNVDYTTTTTAAPTTTTPSPDEKASACSAAETSLQIPATTKYFLTKYPLDTCGSYLYCEKNEKTAKWDTVYVPCPATKPFFDSAKSLCVATKPSSCT